VALPASIYGISTITFFGISIFEQFYNLNLELKFSDDILNTFFGFDAGSGLSKSLSTSGSALQHFDPILLFFNIKFKISC